MSGKFSRSSRRALVASLVGLAVGGGVLASAASLPVNGNTLGAGTTVIASCDTDGVALKYGHTYVVNDGAPTPAVIGAYRTSSVIVSGIASACDGKAMSVTLKGAAGVSLGSGSVPVIPTGGTATVTFPTSPFVDANAVIGAAVVIAD